MLGYELAIGGLIIGMIFLIVRNVRKDKADGRSVFGGSRNGDGPPKKRL